LPFEIRKLNDELILLLFEFRSFVSDDFDK